MVLKNTMKRQFIFIFTLIILHSNYTYAEQLASILQGKIVASDFSSLQAMIKESDGSILDFADISATGTFQLDLTIMDTPSESEVKKLTLEIKSKSGLKKNYPVKQYITKFDDTVLLNPVTFN